jgi:aspartate-semialdehyde dehydrogenase
LAKSQPLKLALVGAETLLGKDLQEIIEARSGHSAISTFAASGEGSFGEEDGEAVYLEPLSAATIAGTSAVLIAGNADGAKKAYALVRAAGKRPLLIDCTGHLESEPEARIIAPLLGQMSANNKWLLVVAHPAATALAAVLEKVANFASIRQAIAEVFEPASERGQRGLSELHQQTTALLSFKSLDKAVFDAQLSFNLLAQYGEEAPLKLLAVEQRIERDLATILAGQSAALPMPSLRLIQAPVFHGYSISLWVEFAGNADAAAISEVLASSRIEVRKPSEDAPTGVGVTGQSGLIVGDIRVDRNNPRAVWIWIVVDNLRLVADAAADILDTLEAVQG